MAKVSLFDEDVTAENQPETTNPSVIPPPEDVLSGNPMDAILGQTPDAGKSHAYFVDETRISTDADLDKLQYGGEITNASDLAKRVEDGEISEYEARLLANRLGINYVDDESESSVAAAIMENREFVEHQELEREEEYGWEEEFEPASRREQEREREQEQEVDDSLLGEIGELEREGVFKPRLFDSKAFEAEMESMDMGVDGHGPSMGQQPDIKAAVSQAMGSSAVMSMDAATGEKVAANLEQTIGDSLVGQNPSQQGPEAAAEVASAVAVAPAAVAAINVALPPVTPPEAEEDKEKDRPATIPFNPTFASVLSNAGMGSLAATIGKLSFTDLGKGAGALFTDAVVATSGKDAPPPLAKTEAVVHDLPPRKTA